MSRFALIAALGCLCGAALAADISLQIESDDGEPLALAEVRITGVGVAFEWAASSDIDGRLAPVDLRAGSYLIEVRAPGFQPFREIMTANALRDDPRVVLRRAPFTQEVTITATMPGLITEQRIDTSDLMVGGSLDIAESMRRQDGLASSRRGAVNLDPSVRGLQESQVAMFVDDTRTFAACAGRMDSEISHVSDASIESVTVVKGPYALAWGAGTLSAIRLETFRPSFTSGDWRSQGRAAVQYGGNASAADLSAAWGGANERFGFFVVGSTRSGNDYEDGDGETVPGDYTSNDLRWSFAFRPGERTTLRYDGGYQKQRDIDYPGRPMDAVFFETRSHKAEILWQPRSGPDEVFGTLYVNDKDHLMNNDLKPTALPDPDRMPPFGTNASAPTVSDTLGGAFRLNWNDGRSRWIAGGDFYLLDQNAYRTIARRDNGALIVEGEIWPDVRIDDVGVYGQWVHDADGARYGGTVRIDRVEASSGRVSDFYEEHTSGDTNRSETNVSAAFSASFDLDPDWTLTAGVGRTVRTANAVERYADRFQSSKFQIAAEFVGDPGIAPEKSLEVDTGARFKRERFEVSADLFYRIVDDYITIQPDPDLSPLLPMSPDTVYRYINGDQARYYGGEARVRQSFSRRWSWRGSASYTWAEDTRLDEPVYGIAPLRGEIGLRFDGGSRRAWWVESSAWMVARQDRVATSRFERETPGYTVYALRGGADLGRGLALRMGIDNLTDHAYANHLNALNPFTKERIREMGRNVYAGLIFDF